MTLVTCHCMAGTTWPRATSRICPEDSSSIVLLQRVSGNLQPVCVHLSGGERGGGENRKRRRRKRGRGREKRKYPCRGHEAVHWVHPRESTDGASPSRQVQVCQGSHTAKALCLRDPITKCLPPIPAPESFPMAKIYAPGTLSLDIIVCKVISPP